MSGVVITRLGEVRPSPEPVASPPPAPLPEGEPWLAHRLEGSPGADLFPRARLRRLGRAQAMALSAVRLSLQSAEGRELAAAGDDVAVCLGTAWAELGVELAFLENMIRRGEKGARPTKFANSVHNALASQVALEFNFTGENHSFTHHNLSFEDALWQGRNLVARGRARRVVVCGVDALTDFLLLRGRLLGEHVHPGEGAAALVLSKAEETRQHLARLDLVRARGSVKPGEIDTAEQAVFLEEAAAEAGIHPGGYHLLTGANGDPSLDAAYRQVAGLLDPAGGVGVYRHLTGDFATASALGLALAVRSVSGGALPREIRLVLAAETHAPRPVLLYHLNSDGSHSAIIVSP